MNFSSNIICDQVRTLSLFSDQQIWHKVEPILRDPEHARPCMGSSNTCLMGSGSDHWHTKPTEEETFSHCSYYYWSLLYSAILRFRADSLRSHVILHEWIAFYSAFFEYPPKWCTYSAGMAGATWNCCHLLKAWSAIWIVVTILYGFTRVAVWLGLSGVYWEYDSSGVRMWVGCSMGVRGGGLEGQVFSVKICIMDFLFDCFFL